MAFSTEDTLWLNILLASNVDAVSTPIFARTDAIGSLMRKKLGPVTAPLFERLSILRGAV